MLRQIEGRLDLLLQRELERGVPEPLVEAARYSLLAPGKRLRPLLCVAAAGGADEAFDPAIALECLHTYSLIHDDLPCMDDDAMRRGKPSSHIAFGEAQALLAGDYLLTLSFDLLAQAPGLTPQQRLDCIALLAAAAGGAGMVGGQWLDIEGGSVSPQKLEKIARTKTGALISCAVEMGGVISHAAHRSQLREVGSLLGLAFQIADDLSDSDDAAPNFGRILGLETSANLAVRLQAQALDLLAQLPQRLPQLEQLAQQMVQLPSSVC